MYYSMKFAALIPFANPENDNSWSGLTTAFTILPRE